MKKPSLYISKIHKYFLKLFSSLDFITFQGIRLLSIKGVNE